MTVPPHRHVEDRPQTPAKPRKRAKPNALRNAQVLPPHNVDLTLSPAPHDDIHVPAHVSGSDLSREAPADAGEEARRRIRAARSK